MSDFDFKKLQTKRPLWQDGLFLAGILLITWGASHLVLNRGAFAQIAEFKYETLKASVFESFDTEEAPEETKDTPAKGKIPVSRAKNQIETLHKVSHKRETVTFRTKNLKPKNQAKEVFEDIKVYPSDNRLVIPRIGKNVPLVDVPQHQNWNQLENNIQEGLQNGVVVHPVSHAPGSFGNFFVTGHSSYYAWDEGRFKDVFALLHEVKVGDIVEVYWEGKKFEYKIRDSKVVPPTADEILDQPDHLKILTLMTCTPVGTNTNRLILTAELKEN